MRKSTFTNKILRSIAMLTINSLLLGSSATAMETTVNINNDYVTEGDFLFGAMEAGAANNFRVNIKNSNIGPDVLIYGAISNYGFSMDENFGDDSVQNPAKNTANGNIVYIDKSAFSVTQGAEITGGFSALNPFTGVKGAAADKNVVYINATNNAGNVTGGEGNSASQNIVYYEANGNGFANRIIGGSATGITAYTIDATEGVSSEANNNHVIFVSGKAKQIVGGSSAVNADNNIVTLLGGNLEGANAYLGKTNAVFSYIAGGVVTAEGGSAVNNTVNIGGYIGTINKSYTGEDEKKLFDADSSVNYNSEVPTFNGKIYGGYSTLKNNETAELKKDNTLNVFGASKGIENVVNFSKVNFYIPSTIHAGESLLELTGKPIDLTYYDGLKRYKVEYIDESTDLAGVIINSNFSTMPSLKQGENFVLLSNPNGILLDKATFNINNRSTDKENNAILAQELENGIEINKIGYTMDSNTISLECKELSLTGILLDNGIRLEKELLLNKEAAKYSQIYGAYGEENAIVDLLDTVCLPKSKLIGSNISTNNTLNVYALNNSLNNIQAFNKINFYIPNTSVNGSSMLNLTDSAQINLQATNINAGVQKGASLKKGDNITLIATEGGLVTDESKFGTITQGIATEYLVNLKNDGKNLIANIDKRKLSKAAKSPVETMNAGIGLLNSGQDLAVTAGIISAKKASPNQERTFSPYATIGGSSMRLSTGSHLDTKNWNMCLGVAKNVANKYGTLLIAPVLEQGKAKYDSYLDNGVHGSGNAKFSGAGLLVQQNNSDGLFYEVGIRGGRQKLDYVAKNGISKNSNYDVSNPYWGGHIGIGKNIKISSAKSITYYGRFLYNHQNGSSVKIKTMTGDDRYGFDSIASKRTRAGVRFNRQLNKGITLYGDLAWQYEFDGTARAVTSVGKPASPSLKGHSGIAELGCLIDGTNKKHSLEVGLNTAVGKQRGYGLNLNWAWKF